MITARIVPQGLAVSIGAAKKEIQIGNPIAREYVEREAYAGPYTVTPSDEAQVLHTDEKRMTGDVTVEKIPSNYGKITWNGSVLTVT